MSATLEAYPSLDGDMNIGYAYRNLPGLVHVIAKAPGGAVFSVGNHFDECDVCKEHGVTLADFDRFMMGQRS